jgi:hypothetical protein
MRCCGVAPLYGAHWSLLTYISRSKQCIPCGTVAAADDQCGPRPTKAGPNSPLLQLGVLCCNSVYCVATRCTALQRGALWAHSDGEDRGRPPALPRPDRADRVGADVLRRQARLRVCARVRPPRLRRRRLPAAAHVRQSQRNHISTADCAALGAAVRTREHSE